MSTATTERVQQVTEDRRRGVESRTGKELKAPDGAELRLDALADAEIRAQVESSDPIGFKGTAALFDKRALIGSGPFGFLEEFRSGAFLETIEVDDIRMLKNHNDDLPLARNTAGSLRLGEVKSGLSTDADMDPTSYARDLAISLDRGTVNQMSVAFEVLDEEWVTLPDDDPDKGVVMEPELRIVKRVKLWEVSPVTFPAYVDTDAALRSRNLATIAERLGLADAQRLHTVASELRKSEPDPEVIRALIGGLDQAPAIAPEERAAMSSTDTRPLEWATRMHALKARELGLPVAS